MGGLPLNRGLPVNFTAQQGNRRGALRGSRIQALLNLHSGGTAQTGMTCKIGVTTPNEIPKPLGNNRFFIDGIQLASLTRNGLSPKRMARAPFRGWTMWKLILLLWLIPTALAILVGSRLWSGNPALSRNQRRLLFDERRARELTPWLLIKLAVLASSFFMIGLVEGVILLNLPFVWLALAASLTGSAAILLSALWVRSSSQLPRIFRRVVARTASRRRQRAQISSD